VEKVKKLVKRFLFLPPMIALVAGIVTLTPTFLILALGDSNSWFSYLIYVLAAYGLTVLVIAFPKIVRTFRDGFWNLKPIKWLLDTKIGHKLLKNTVFRSEISLHSGLVINLAYVALKLVTGIMYRSVWLIALAAYYLLLAIMRSVLVGYVHKTPVGENIPLEFRRYRACGIILLFMNQALAAIVIYIVHLNQGFSYPGFLIYGMALYAFYAIISAVINVVKFRKIGSPVLSAAKVINLTAAMVSMLSLETAMLSEFGGDQPEFRRIMTGISGGIVCTLVLIMAIYMIVRASVNLKKEQF
jgi:hypothetical protein